MAEGTENKILVVARKQFIQNGFAGTRMQEIADEAGINKAMLHYYFRSKEKLYQEITVKTINTIVPKIAKAMKGEGAFFERVEKIVDTYIEVLTNEPEIPIFMLMELSQKREIFIEELKKQVILFPSIQQFIMVMMKEMEEGKIRQIPPFHLLLNIVGMTVFPFLAKPIFCTIFNSTDEEFSTLMEQRKVVIMDFVKNALRVS